MSMTTSESQKYTSNVEVEMECQPPTISTSETAGVLAQTIEIGKLMKLIVMYSLHGISTTGRRSIKR